MAFIKETVVLVVLIAVLHVAMANNNNTGRVYKVEWNIKQNYTEWSVWKNFTVGDSLEFIYDKTRHNVIAVNQEEYKSCVLADKHEVLDSGNDIIKFKTNGHYFYVCGKPHHCEQGQKLYVRVTNATKNVTPPPKTSPSHDHRAPALAPAPASTEHHNAAVSVSVWSVCGVVAMGFAAFFGI